MKNKVGGPLALVGKASKGISQKEKGGKKRKVLIAESEVDMKSI